MQLNEKRITDLRFFTEGFFHWITKCSVGWWWWGNKLCTHAHTQNNNLRAALRAASNNLGPRVYTDPSVSNPRI